MSQAAWQCVLDQFLERRPVTQVRALGNAGGFSGARLWRVELDDGNWCLRRWPSAHPNAEQLTWIHHVLAQARARGIEVVPSLHPTTAPRRLESTARTIVRWDGSLWELSEWMPGQADYHRTPSTARLRAALQTLARLHEAIADCPPHDPRPRPSHAVAYRLDRARNLQRGQLSALGRAVHRDSRDAFAEFSRRIVHSAADLIPNVARQLEWLASQPFTQQPCLRDVWHDHVLFTGDQVSGLIDFGAMRRETPLLDVARLLGSLAGDDASAWHCGLAAYREVRSLDARDCQAIAVLDCATVLLAGLQWVEWLWLEKRHFEDTERVVRRLAEFAGRLDGLVVRGGRPVLDQHGCS